MSSIRSGHSMRQSAPDRIADILPDDTVTVRIAEEADGSRLLTIENLDETQE